MNIIMTFTQSYLLCGGTNKDRLVLTKQPEEIVIKLFYSKSFEIKTLYLCISVFVGGRPITGQLVI